MAGYIGNNLLDTFLLPTDIGDSIQAYDGDLQAIADIAETTGFLVKTGVDTWTLDTTSYIDAALLGGASGVATLDANGKVFTSQLPALAITNTYVVADQTAMLALTAETGDVAVRTDENKSYILEGADPAVLGDWQELLTPTDAILSVDGQTGAIDLTGTYQAIDADLTAIAALAGTQGILTKTAADTWTLDTNTYLTSETSHADVVVDGDFGSEGVMYRGASGGTYEIKSIGVDIQAYDANTAKTDVVQTFSAPQTFTAVNETHSSVTSTTNTLTIDCSTANFFTHVLTEDTTIGFSNVPTTGTVYGFGLELVQDAGASGFLITWPSSINWVKGTAPTLTQTSSAMDTIVFYTHDGGTTWNGFVSGQDLNNGV